MRSDQRIVVILLICILIFCYFSPYTTIDTFDNVTNLFNSDAPKNAYSFLTRPTNSVSAVGKNPDCTWPCYSDRKHQEWCSEKTAVDYYAMRPIIQYQEYSNNLQKMFIGIIDHIPDNKLISKDSVAFEPKNNCEFKATIIEWLMGKIANQVANMPEMNRNGSWESERFYETDAYLYQYTNDNDVYFKLIFNLYNPLRSTSTMCYAIIYKSSNNSELLLMDINMITREKMGDYHSGINAYRSNINTDIEELDILGFPDTEQGRKDHDAYMINNPNEIEWNYVNTLPVQKFNKDGTYSNVPSENITINGGISDTLRELIKKSNCNTTDNMPCIVQGFTGVLAENTMNTQKLKLAKVDGTVKDIHMNPRIVYRNVETANGTMYI